MKKYFALLVCLVSASAYSQNDNPGLLQFETEMKSFKLDTSEVPNDDLTKAIRELRKIRGAFNINTVIDFKIAEQRAKKEMPEEDLRKLELFFSEGNGKKWLDNAIIRIYRNQYSLEEVQQIGAFYKTSAGQKMAGSFPLIIFQSLKAAELITEKLKNPKPAK